jgi:alkaline phosphatase
MTHNAASAIVIDSASSASQMATGSPSGSEMVGLDQWGRPVETVLELAKKKGKSTGLVTDTRVTHATPAAFASHWPHRSMENEIAEELLLSGNVDVMLGGGLRHWIPKGSRSNPVLREQLNVLLGRNKLKIKSKRKDSKNLLLEAKARGYDLAFGRDQLLQSKGKKLLGLFSYSGMAHGIDHRKMKNDPLRTKPTLKDMTRKALDVLSKNKKGFFLMVEAGQIDWAGHQNDAGTMLNEMVKFEETLAYVYDWVKDRKDTLVVVTADHETGSFGFSYSKRNLWPKAKTLPGRAFKKRGYKPNFNFGAFSLLDKIYDQKKTLVEIIAEYQRLEEKGPEDLVRLVEQYTSFSLTEEEAKKIMEQEKNSFRVKNHKYLSSETIPKIEGPLKSFYVYPSEANANNLGLMLSKRQNTVWGTGTHTNTPVPLIFFSPDKKIKIKLLQSNTDLGKFLKQIVKG